MFGARLGTASRRSQSSMNSASVGSSGSSSGSASRARQASTNSRTPGQPPVSFASSKSRSQRRAVSMRLKVSRPARRSAIELGLPAKADDMRRAGLAGVIERGVERGHTLGTAGADENATYPRSPCRSHAAFRSSNESRAARPCARAPPDRSRCAWASVRRAGGARTGAAPVPGAVASGEGVGGMRACAGPAHELGPPHHDPAARDRLHDRELPGRVRPPQRLNRRPGVRAFGRIADECGASLIESEQRVVHGRSGEMMW